MDSETESLHIGVFPWLAFGHMLPFLELSKSLAQRGHRISFISTPRNIERLPKLPPQLTSLIHFIPLPLPTTPGLPQHVEATTDIPPHKQEFLKLAYDGLQQPLSQFIQQSNPKLDWIIHDFTPHWLPSIAKQSNIPTIFLSIYSGGACAYFGPPSELDSRGNALRTKPEDFSVSPPWFNIPSKLRWLPYEYRSFVANLFRPNASGVSDSYRFAVAIAESNACAFRSCYEFEGDYLKILENIYRKDIIPVGLIPPPLPDSPESDSDPIIEWLDTQKPKSVIYAAFGSEVVLSDELMGEVALGLEMSEVAFILVLRQNVLPAGFEERVKGRGLVVKRWVQQVRILGHDSVGGTLTHAGWSSCIESVTLGQPMVMLPMFGDNRFNQQRFEEMGIGFSVKMSEEDGTFDREAVTEVVRKLMVEEDGEECRNKARELGKVIESQEIQKKYVEGFEKYLKEHRGEGNKSKGIYLV